MDFQNIQNNSINNNNIQPAVFNKEQIQLEVQDFIESCQVSVEEKTHLYRDLKDLFDEDIKLENTTFKASPGDNKVQAHLKEITSPPIGRLLFSSDERKEKLTEITNYSDNATPGGSSLLFQLFQDYYYKLQKNYLTQKKKNLLSKKSQNYKKQPFELSLEFNKLFGIMGCVASTGSLWTSPISSEPVPIAVIQDKVMNEIDLLLDYISASPNKLLSPFTDYLHLLKDVLSNNTGDLYKPIALPIDLSNSFDRLKFRAAEQKETLEALEKTCFFNDHFKKFPTHKRLFKKGVDINIEFLHKLISKIESNAPTSEVYDLLFQEQLKNYSIKQDPLSKFSIVLENDTDHQETDSFILYITYNILNNKDSIVQEGILKCLADVSNGSTHEVDDFLKEIIDTVKEIKYKSNTFLLKKINQLETQGLNHYEKKYLNKITSYLTMSELLSKDRADALIELLTFRLEKNQASSSSIPRAYAMRDVVLQFSGTMPHNFRKLATALAKDQRLFHKLFNHVIRDEIHQLSNMLSNMLHMHLESSEAVNARLRLLIDQKETLLNEGSKNIVENEKKKPSRKKKQKKRNTNQIKNEPSPTNEGVIRASAEPIQKVITLTASDRVDPFEHFSEMRKNLKALKKTTYPTISQQRYFNAGLRNIKHIIRHLEETCSNQFFGIDKLFGESDEFRRLAEAALGLGTLGLPENAATFSLDQIQSFGHSLSAFAIHIHENAFIQSNVKDVVLKHLQIINLFSQGNASTNYLHMTRDKQTLQEQASSLTQFLSQVEIEAARRRPNFDRQKNLLQKHQNNSQLILSFVSELLQALADPNYVIEKKEAYDISILEATESFSQESICLEPIEENEIDLQDNAAGVENNSQINIQTRSDAIEAIENALAWLRIRTLYPVDSPEQNPMRKKSRNQAFENVKLYLLRLKDKLNNNQNVPYDSIVEEMKLMRRAHKELGIGLLYHENFTHNGQHIIDAENLRYKNNPCLINKILLAVSPQGEFLPDLNHAKYKWMSEAHQWLNYPELQWEWDNQNPSPWQSQINTVVDAIKILSRQKRSLERSSEEIDILCLPNVCKNIEDFVENQEREKIYTSLSALLHTVIYGMPIQNQAEV